MYIKIMEVDWDPKKARINWAKHHVYFSDAEVVLYDPNALTMSDHYTVGEHRFVTTGSDALNRILTIVYTYRDDVIRLISARKATKNERCCYEKRV